MIYLKCLSDEGKWHKTQVQTAFKGFIYIKRKELGFQLKKIWEMSDEFQILFKVKRNITPYFSPTV